MTQRVLVIVGTRPEAIKLAPVALALQASPVLEPVLVSTGQHRDIVAPMLATFGLRADVDLGVGRPQQSLNALASRLLSALDETIEQHRPSAIIVQGDTTSVLCGALAGFHRGVPVVHVEAGLRTTDLHNPFPEEANRRLVGRIADLHLAPTEAARQALLAEGVPPSAVLTSGNTVVDALLRAIDLPPEPTGDARLDALLAHEATPLVLITTHRRESHGAPMRRTLVAIRLLAEARPGTAFVLPVHPNPAVTDLVRAELGWLPNVVLTAPLGYLPFVRVMQRATLILTDSGGVQEEAPALGKPVLVLRDNTERPEGVAAGTAILVGTDTERIVTWASRLLDDPALHRAMAGVQNPYGDGRASERVCAAVEHLLGLRDAAPEPFVAQRALGTVETR